MDNIPWIEKYRPKRYTDLVFSDDVHHKALEWIREYPKHGRMLLLCGPSGTGKTSLAYVLANIFGLNIVELNAGTNMEWIDKALGMSGTINGKKNLILVEDADSNVAEGLKKLVSMVSASHPIIVISNDVCLKGVYTVNVKRPGIDEVKKAIEKVCVGEGILIDHCVFEMIMEDSGADLRAIINHLQVCGVKRLGKTSYMSIKKRMCLHPYKIAQIVLSGRLRWQDHEESYSECLMGVCHSSYPYNTSVLGVIADICDDLSAIDVLHESLRHICIPGYARCSNRNVEIVKSEWCKDPKPSVIDEMVIPYLSRYESNNLSGRRMLHIKAIAKMYDVKDLNIRDDEVIEVNKSEQNGKFRFRYKSGSSSAVKRDISVRELMEC
ncbi:large subunit of replication factor C [Ordospora colligata]|nr:large subunit of replication factor C [Ordospora colligata]